ncbi:MAG TPA: Fe-S cluster assembly protein SufD [bacterium]|nr:Fe-S cluster assembly protein SufD [bacterium]HPN36134.1 Fe-S cluster assembly protein SufD [bacterium]
MKPFAELLAGWEKKNQTRMPESLQALKQTGREQFFRQGLPTRRHEAWRFTDIEQISEIDWRAAAAPPLTGAIDLLRPLTYWDSDAFRLVFVNGRLNPEWSTRRTDIKGLRLTTAAEILQGNGKAAWQQHLGRIADSAEFPFTSLNTALFEQGAFIEVESGVELSRPIHLYYVSVGDGAAAVHPRNLFVLGPSSRTTIVETFIGLGGYLTNHVSEWLLHDNAAVDHYKVQREALSAFHVSRTAVHQQANSRYQCHVFSFGSRLERTDLTVTLDGAEVETGLDGLYLAQSGQWIDHHTLLHHQQPHGNSRQLYKGILTGEGGAVFNGRIKVSADAQKTDALQSNKNLLLSDGATVHAQPQLEISADDVRCTHGGTVGQLDPEALFYLQTRGLSRKDAVGLLVHAFAGEIVDRIRTPILRGQVETWVHEFLQRETE